MSTITEFEKEVCIAQSNFVLGIEAEDHIYDYYGDTFYPVVQEFVNKQIKLFPKPAPKPVKTKMSSKEKIVHDNTIRLIGESVAPRRNLFKNPIPVILLQSNTLELRSIGFCFMAYTLIEKIEDSTHIIYGLIVSMQRFINSVEKNAEFSKIALDDLIIYCKRITSFFKFSGQNIPDALITSAPFDEYIPKKSVRPYEHQIEANKLLYDPILARSGFIAVYSTATNSGKTFTAVGLAKRVDKLRTVFPKMQFLFSCVVDSVRKKVGTLFQASNISYGVALLSRCDTKGCGNYGKCDKHVRENGEHFYIQDPVAKEILKNTESNRNMLLDEGYTIREKSVGEDGESETNTRETKKWQNKKLIAIIDGEFLIRNPASRFNTSQNFTAIICKPEIAYYFLQRENADNSTVLFLDEFTLNATQLHSKELRDHMNVISIAPKWTYLSNANFVGDERIRVFLDIHNNRFPSSSIVHIASNVVFSCSNIYTFSGKECLPHMDAKNSLEFTKKRRLILENQFKGRMYNPRAIRQMYNMAVKLIKWNFDDEDDGVDAESISKTLSKLPDIDTILGDVTQLYPDNIRKIGMQILSVVDEMQEDEVVNIFSRIPKPVINPIDILNLDYFRFPGMNLVGNPNPETFALKMFANHLKTIKSRIGSLEKMRSTFDALSEKWQENYDNITSRITNKSDEKRSAKILTDISDAQDDMMSHKPKIGFPDELQIGTFESLKGQKREKMRIPLDIKNIDVELMKNEDKILLLYAGVGIYSSTEKDRSYLEEVLNLASNGNLEFLISDISYGMDYPFSCVFITKEFSEERSMNDIYQLICRGGRGRLGNSAQIYIEDDCMQRIISTVDETSEIELRNMIASILCN